MKVFEGILALTLALILFFFLIRGVIRLYADSVLKKRDMKSRQKNQSFSEWFFYKRYKDILPKSKIVWYYSNFAEYLIALIAMIVFYSMDMHDFARGILLVYFYFKAAVFVVAYSSNKLGKK